MARTETKMNYDHLIPEHTKESLHNYFKHGWKPGGFVESMLALDMERAIQIADQANAPAFCYIGRWISEHAPVGSWGNYEAIEAWCANKDERRTKWVTWDTLITEPKRDKDLEF